MPQRPMQTHTQRQAWGGHSAIAHPPPYSWPASSLGRTSVPTPGPKGTAGWESAFVCLDAWSADTGGRGVCHSSSPRAAGEWGQLGLWELRCLETEQGLLWCN